ncbi:hypothetical protein HRG_004482 [Hirsutella rhossiliensis]|uniref:Uncharacterized protein n=1 Tax=Hirsutella rhossiliensis TaxID=111463 RepID=A0A9P8SJC0_9HYPO|nr:uncharacterized protein HRG_04482 [Hirsutella rhossiliensis]KAH0964054.1 hypothetical protein HRG_04482 [Hirsutella rhossiliensis]
MSKVGDLVHSSSLDAIVGIGLSERRGLLDQGHYGQRVGLRECLYPTARKQSLHVRSYDYYKLLDRLSNLIRFYRQMAHSSVGWDAIVLCRANKRLEQYMPERFVGEQGKRLQSSSYRLLGRSKGRIRRNISPLEQAVLLASLVRRDEFVLLEGFEIQRFETMIHILREMPLKAWRRTGSFSGGSDR